MSDQSIEYQASFDSWVVNYAPDRPVCVNFSIRSRKIETGLEYWLVLFQNLRIWLLKTYVVSLQ